ncbi:hypothetical protein [Saccharopolyspora dendranthemae]|uniref:Uncharacterized protein n=1 Tax=Saccharopolyspora dendranthemae TaxID=1181886 RepID=A0A561V7H7_9PSEU|nr:hypothetical protein [Saccharopolyspora dendranthemae]TWG07571.1 hypothetical protein FHU35_11188 [Saccharopolyspora dendranthemae]
MTSYGERVLLERDIDPITAELISIATERRLRPLCWHIKHDATDTTATGYVTVSLLHEADAIRCAWADALSLYETADGYAGNIGTLIIGLPAAIDPDEHCRVCNRPFEPRDTRPNGRARYQSGDLCRSCISTRGSRGFAVASNRRCHH